MSVYSQLLKLGTLEEDTAGAVFLLNIEAQEKTNHSTVSKFVDKSLFKARWD